MIKELIDLTKFFLVIGYYGSCLILLGFIIGDISLRYIHYDLTPIYILWFWLAGWGLFGDWKEL